MEERAAVLSELNGSLAPRVLFVAEAPGRKGADRTRVPMSGDASGTVFRRLMEINGLSNDEVFITNAVLCSPRSVSGANRTPKASEIRNCSAFLTRAIELLDPPIVASVGVTALAALDRIEPHGCKLSEIVATPISWHGRTLIALYHLSPQVLISHRNLAQQELDWRVIRSVLDRAG